MRSVERVSRPACRVVGYRAGEYEKAEADARKCLEIAPQFMKGVYRLANAQMGLERFDDAEATIRGGLARDPDNPELKKLARIVKGKRDKARRGKLAKTAAPEIDAQTKKEAQDLSEKLQQHGRELNETKARLNAIRREIQRTTITCARGVVRSFALRFAAAAARLLGISASRPRRRRE